IRLAVSARTAVRRTVRGPAGWAATGRRPATRRPAGAGVPGESPAGPSATSAGHRLRAGSPAASPAGRRPARAGYAIAGAGPGSGYVRAAAAGWRRRSAAEDSPAAVRESFGVTCERLARDHVDQRFLALADRRRGFHAQGFEQAEVLGAAPPQVRVGDVAGLELEALVADHVQVLRGTFLHVHRVAEQPADHPGIDIGLGGLGEQQVAARLEHAVELGQGAILLDQVMEG